MKRVQPRTPAGVPTGGEFASKTHGEADISLVGAPPASGRTVEAFELAFQQGSSDKFYRVFVWEDDAGGHAVVQYGRTGTSGTAKQTDYPDGAAASAFAAKQLKAKKAKGYLPTAESAFDLDVIDIDDGPVSPLDLEAAFNRNRGAATELVADATADDAAKAAAAAERMASLAVDSDWQPTATEEDVRRALADFEMDNTADLLEAVPQLADTVPKAELAAHLDNPAWVGQRKCLAPMAPVLTSAGWRPARYINAGDLVLTSDGQFHKVEDVWSSPREGRSMVRVQPWCAQPFDVTGDHEVLTTGGWKEAADLSLDDWLVIPQPQLDRSEIVETVVLDAGSGYTKTITMDPEFAWFCGLWMGDGSAQGHHNGKTTGRVRFAINRRDQHLVERVKAFASDRLGCEPHVFPHGDSHMDEVFFTDLPLARWLTENFRHRAPDGFHIDASSKGKSLPGWADGWDDEAFDAFLSGYLAADGYTSTDPRNEGSTTQQRVVTVSPHISALLYRQLLARGIPVSIRKFKTSWTHLGAEKTGSAWELGLIRSENMMRLVDGRWEVKVRSLGSVQSPPKTVFDLTIEGTHDLMSGTIVHNCDGDRMMIRVTDGTVEVLNRHGQPKTTNITAGVVATFSPLKTGTWCFDGEMVGQRLHLFDLAHADGYVDANSTFDRRHAALEAAVGALDSPHVAVLGHTGGDAAAKRGLLDQVKAEKGEGIILRRADAPYRHGNRGHGLLKHKFVNEADVYVKSVDPSKESVTLAVRDASGKERIVGKASTIGKGAIAVGDTVEVEFQYVLDPANPTMVQPRIQRRRDDKPADQCSLDQFAEAGTNKDVPADEPVDA